MPLEIQVQTAQVLELTADVIVVGVLQAGGKAGLPPSLKPVDEALGGALGKLAAQRGVHGQARSDAHALDARAGSAPRSSS